MQGTSNIPAFEGPEDVLRRRTARAQQNTLETEPTVPVQRSAGRIPNTPLAASTISFLLGSLFTFGCSIFISGGLHYWWATPQLGFFLAAWSVFHWGEFAVTAGWNREKCSVDSFLLENGVMYHIAHSTALFEYLLTLYIRPSWKSHEYATEVGIALVIIGQALRSMAMIHAATNFSHAIAWKKLEKHELVTDGIYAWFRHPSYTGFFYWALGTQLVLQNAVSFVFFVIVLWRFFSSRIRVEEQALTRFFGQDYVQYKAKVGTKIPFIP